jgi:hypothetical protein
MTYYSKGELISAIGSNRYPLVCFKRPNSLSIFVDRSHPMLASCSISIVEIIASEVATYLFDMYRTLASNPGHSVSSITWQIIRKYWIDKVEISPSLIEEKCNNFLSRLKSKLAENVDNTLSDTLFNELSSDQQTIFVQQILKQGLQLQSVQTLKESGAFIKFVPNDFILNIFATAPEIFFNGKFWNVQYGINIPGLSAMNLDSIYKYTLQNYRNSLETIILYMDKKPQSTYELKKVDSVLNFMCTNLTEELE